MTDRSVEQLGAARAEAGLFPVPKEIEFTCSCPDHASMCKHVAAVLYGVGARFDAEPQLFFALRQVDSEDLIAAAAGAEGFAGAASGRVGNALEDADRSRTAKTKKHDGVERVHRADGEGPKRHRAFHSDG